MPAGRPKIEIDFEIVENLCSIHCTGEEIASVLGVDYDTLVARVKETYNMNFSDYIEQKKAGGKASLRRRQWATADGGNVTMQIWLGKQYLGQSDKQETAHSGSLGISIIDDIKQCKKE